MIKQLLAAADFLYYPSHDINSKNNLYEKQYQDCPTYKVTYNIESVKGTPEVYINISPVRIIT